MKISPITKLAIAGAGATLLLFIGLGGLDRPPVPQRTGQSLPAAPSNVVATGLTLTSTNVDSPDDNAVYPAGLHADVVNENCASCHSTSMVLTQPPLSAAQWTEEVAKMRTVYKAPIAEADVPAIIAYLEATSAKLAPARPTGTAQAPR